MKPNSSFTLLLASLALVLMATPATRAQADSTLYLAVDCMKSTSPDYVSVERDIWKPMHQELIDQGNKERWVMWGVRFGSRAECDYYTVNVFRGLDAVGNDLSDLPAIFAKVHPDADFDEAMAKTLASRELVWTQLWTMMDVVGTPGSSYAYINRMAAPNGGAYVDQERTFFKPIHEAFVADDLTKGWGLYRLVSPGGSSMGYNFLTVDFVGGPTELPWGEYAEKVHPDADIDEAFTKTMAVRDMVGSELWYLVDRAAR